MTSFINLNLTEGFAEVTLPPRASTFEPGDDGARIYCGCAGCQPYRRPVSLIHPTRQLACVTCHYQACTCCIDCAAYPCTCAHCGECDRLERRCVCCGNCDSYPCQCCAECERRPGYCMCCGDCDDYPCRCNECSECESDPCHCGSEYVHGYSYVPDLQFHRAEDETDANLFLGFELEVPSNRPAAIANRLANSYGDAEDVLYCKEDSSIRGIEIVSHPMTHKYLREEFDVAAMFRDVELREHLSQLTPFPEGYGLHVHVSRTGFKSEAHTLRWLLLIYRNASEVERIARRTSDQWAAFSDSNLCVAKAKNRDRYGDPYPGGRYVAVNATNRHTFELRMFRSTWRLSEFRAALDFAHASVIYTRTLTASDVLRGDALAWPAFLVWCATRSEYSYLTAFTTNAKAV